MNNFLIQKVKSQKKQNQKEEIINNFNKENI